MEEVHIRGMSQVLVREKTQAHRQLMKNSCILLHGSSPSGDERREVLGLRRKTILPDRRGTACLEANTFINILYVKKKRANEPNADLWFNRCGPLYTFCLSSTTIAIRKSKSLMLLGKSWIDCLYKYTSNQWCTKPFLVGLSHASILFPIYASFATTLICNPIKPC